MSGASGSRAYKSGVAVAIVASLLITWTTVVRDDGNGMASFFVILAVLVGGFAAWFRAAGMARTMAGVAVLQILQTIAIATAPSTATLPGGAARVMLVGGGFVLLWLASAACFRAAAKADR